MSERLRKLLIERIVTEGPITFADFMETALYDPEDGFYADSPIGADRHFVTSPHVSPAFGDLLARQLAQCWDALGRPERFDVVELGAGDGTLARQILRATAASPELTRAIRYVGVERSPGARAALTSAGLDAAPEAPDEIRGCVIANELLDNVPFHRLRERDGRVLEIFVGADGGRLLEVEGEPTPEALAAAGAPFVPGEERPVSPAALKLVDRLTRTLQRGYAFVFDYAFEPGRSTAPAHAYRDHRILADVLEEPGSQDVTAAVDLAAVTERASAAGLQAWGPVPQEQALLALGFRLWAAGVRARQAEAEARGDWRSANRLFSERSRAGLLVDPSNLGALQLVALATRDLPPPAAILGDPDRGC